MRNKCVQMSLYDTYKCVAASMEDDKPKLFRQLDEHIDWDSLIPARFYLAFYRNIGRPRKYPLVAFLKSLVLQKIFGYVNDSVLLVTLRHSREMRNFCGFEKVPDAAKLTRFKQDFLPYIMEVFERLVELTEPICREMDAELAGSLIYDTTGIESHVAENNPKFFSAKLRQAKLMTKTNPDTDPYRAVYSLLCVSSRRVDDTACFYRPVFVFSRTKQNYEWSHRANSGIHCRKPKCAYRV